MDETQPALLAAGPPDRNRHPRTDVQFSAGMQDARASVGETQRSPADTAPVPGAERAPGRSALLRYQPKCLSQRQWAAARDACLRPVLDTRSLSDKTALLDLSVLCDFLAQLPEWDHTEAPDLAALLNERTLAAHDSRLAMSGRSPATRNKARGSLRRVMRALRGDEVRVKKQGSARGSAVILSPEEIAVLVHQSEDPDTRRSAASAVALAAQLGAGMPQRAAARLTSAAFAPGDRTISHGGTTFGVLADMSQFLRHAQDALAQPQPDLTSGLLPDTLARPWWLLSHFLAGTPVAVVDHVSRAATGAGLQRHELERLRSHLPRTSLDHQGPSAPHVGAGTLSPDSQAVARALKAAPTALSPEVPNEMSTDSQTNKPHARRKPSRAAALRAAKQAQEQTLTSAGDVLGLDTEIADTPAWSTLSPEVQNRIANYVPLRVPREQWTPVEPIARRLLVARLVQLTAEGNNPGFRKVNVVGSHLARYLSWAHQHIAHESLEDLARTILEETTLDNYTTTAMTNEPRATTASRRSEVRGALRAARPGPHPPRLSYRPIRAPYPPALESQHVRLIRNQPTATLQRGLAFIIAAGYGAGLDARDMATVRACDIYTRPLSDGETAVLIRVGGERARVVVVRQQYADLIQFAIRLHHDAGRGRRDPMIGSTRRQRNPANHVLERLVTAEDGIVEIEVQRLRSTWLVAQMSAPVPLGALLGAAGLRSARALVDLLPYTAVPDEDVIVELMRAPHRPHPALDTTHEKESA